MFLAGEDWHKLGMRPDHPGLQRFPWHFRIGINSSFLESSLSY